tara:strand:+ start:3186 stop:3854 length:669 start_codon:yes stop_codon:yes gene_type:complete
MGVIIYAGDDKDFKTGDYIVMYGEITSPPTAPNTTYILHCESFPMSLAKEWAGLVQYRLVVIPRKGIRGVREGDNILIHKSAKTAKSNYNSPINAMFKWNDRNRAWKTMKPVPLALAEAFHRVNRPDGIEEQRIISKARYQMEEEYAKAALVFGITPIPNDFVSWPKKKADEDDSIHFGFRSTDVYADMIVQNAPEVRNKLRTIDQAPSTIKKRKETLLEWL